MEKEKSRHCRTHDSAGVTGSLHLHVQLPQIRCSVRHKHKRRKLERRDRRRHSRKQQEVLFGIAGPRNNNDRITVEGEMTMRTLRRWCWVSALLVMAVGADVSADSLTEKAVRLVREDFHKSNEVKKAFQVSSMLSSEKKEQSDGTFVEVKFTMKQTKCRKHKWMKPECTPKKEAKRTFHCLGCFKFDSNGNLLKTGYEKCVRQRRTKEVKKEREKACAKLKEPDPVYEPGSYNFRRGSSGRYG